MNKRKWTDEQFITAVKSSFSYAEVMNRVAYDSGSEVKIMQ